MSFLKATWPVVCKALEVQKTQTEKKRASQWEFSIRDEMYLSTKFLKLGQPCKKLDPKYIGPFLIINLVGREKHCKVNEILDFQYHKRKLKYLVLWKRFPLTEAEWVAVRKIHAPRCFQRFHASDPDRVLERKAAVYK
ncbi:hypothetical protein E2320_002536 [Naja naja]|nr:hypothetical protein E2320_002536 [Naja naja]